MQDTKEASHFNDFHVWAKYYLQCLHSREHTYYVKYVMGQSPDWNCYVDTMCSMYNAQAQKRVKKDGKICIFQNIKLIPTL